VFSSNAPAIHNWQAELLVVLIKWLEQVFLMYMHLHFGCLFCRCLVGVASMNNEWQKDYLKMLVLRGTIVMHLEVVEEASDELIEEINSIGNACVFYEAVQTSTLGPLHWKGR